MLAAAVAAAEPPLVVAGDWSVKVGAVELAVAPAVLATVKDEALGRLPVYNPKAPGWGRGAKLRGVTTQETTARFMLDPATLVLKSAKGEAPAFKRGVDYEFDPEWGTLGRLAGGAIGATTSVWADYQHGLCRLDTVVRDAAGVCQLLPGKPHVANAQAPELPVGAAPLANVWVPGRLAKLSADNLFPITETAYPESPAPTPLDAQRLVPKAWAKLIGGQPLRILAWGDSVTEAGYLPSPADKWQNQFVERLGKRFPTAKIELLHLGWGGRNTNSFLAEPPGSKYNYAEKVLGCAPDLIVSEFVNDAWMNPAQVEERYSKLLADFQRIGAEWIILTPHYVRPDWMALKAERAIDDDPRPYVAGLRAFAAKHNVGLADAARRWGRLWRQGVPYTTLLLNAINHPDRRGQKLFADALMPMFGE